MQKGHKMSLTFPSEHNTLFTLTENKMEQKTEFATIFWVRSHNGTHSKVFYDLSKAMNHFNYIQRRCDGAIISKTETYYDDRDWESLFESCK